MGGNDDRFADLQAGFNDAALDDGKFFHRAFNPEIPAGHHDGIRGIDDFLDVFHRVLVLDFSDDVGVTSEALQFGPHGIDIGALAAKAQGEIVHLGLHPDDNVFEVLFRHGGQVDLHSRQIDVASRAEHALGQHLALHAVFLLGQDFHVDVPVVHHDDVPVVNVVDQTVIVHVHRVVLLAFGSADGEFHHIPRVQIQIGGHVAGADGGALGIHHDGDVG